MTEKQLEGNKIIGEFMGGQVKWTVEIKNLQIYSWSGDIVSEYRVLSHMPPGDSMLCEHMEFHSNWNWIIKAAKKCIKTYHDRRSRIFSALISKEENIEELFDSVVEFIKWYNECTEEDWIVTNDYPYPKNK